MSKDLTSLEAIIGWRFRNKDILLRALTHSSSGKPNYERLEFLGDRVLGLVIAEELYKKFTEESEGLLAKRFSALVRRETLADIAKEIKLENFVIVSEYERLAGGLGNDNLLSDTVEALLGAIYLDGGIAPCRDIVQKFWAQKFETMAAPPQEPKTALQEWAQARGLAVPSYQIIAQEGPDHAPVFTIELLLEGFNPVHAKGPSRRLAEKEAALSLLNQLDAEE